MGRIYISSPIDEVQLAHKARTHVDDFEGRIPTAGELTELTQPQDLDMATITFDQSRREIDANAIPDADTPRS